MSPASKAGKHRSCRSTNSSQSRLNTLAASRREARPQPLVRMTPPMSQNIGVMSAKDAILQTWESTGLKRSSLCFLRESSNLGHCLYNNIRELLQTVFPKLRQVQPDGASSGLLQGFKFRQRQRELQIPNRITSAGNGHIFRRV